MTVSKRERAECDAYANWLIDQINVIKDRDYTDLLYALFDIEFYSIIEYDEDRGADGIALRDAWADEVGFKGSLDFGYATVLEVLIGISKRIEFQIFGSRYIDEWDYVKIFWDLLWNLGLCEFDGTLLCYTFEEIDKKVSQWLERRYFRHKKGNIFMIKNDNRDMRKLNIWTQMGLYIREKWPK